ncbi:hypothetical protein BDN70DRAFT_873452 [Pholiota conissans]|uniref:Uncharacterized protein n=1 Tax=Pholiota conissans TaxID=109636 RepID=A0A9P6CX90_9AGAR|nr:hypothetical protein BDN70DRAFT_873452 [Pholiota conissans]
MTTHHHLPPEIQQHPPADNVSVLEFIALELPSSTPVNHLEGEQQERGLQGRRRRSTCGGYPCWGV